MSTRFLGVGAASSRETARGDAFAIDGETRDRSRRTSTLDFAGVFPYNVGELGRLLAASTPDRTIE